MKPFDQYLKLVTQVCLSVSHKAVQPSTTGVTAREAFVAYDTYGKVLPCSEPQLLQAVLNAKEQLNLTIKLWVEDCIACLLSPDEVKTYCTELPKWVLKAFTNQLHKQALKQIGFIPTLLQ